MFVEYSPEYIHLFRTKNVSNIAGPSWSWSYGSWIYN